MERLEMENRLYDAAFEGNVDALNQLHQENRFILSRVCLTCSNYSPFHIAVIQGHEEFVRTILVQNPELPAELESHKKSSPLHLASAKGHLRIVEALLVGNHDLCFVFDQDGRNPLHIAAIKGKIEVLETLIRARPLAAREKTKRGETILHLWVKHGQVQSLVQLVEAGNGIDDDGFLNQRDTDGHTALHLAVLSKQIEMIKFFLTTKIDINAKNANGHTAMDIVSQIPIEQGQEIERFLRQAGALKAEQIQQSVDSNSIPSTNVRANNFPAQDNSQMSNNFVPEDDHTQMPNDKFEHTDVVSPQIQPSTNTLGFNQHANFRWFEQRSKEVMVVASLIATMAFQAGTNPPGGAWQDDLTTDSNGNPVPDPHRAGEAIMANHKLHYYKYFLRFNTTAFVSSLGTILLLISGLPFKNNIFMWILRVVMWLTATSIALTYGFSIAYVTPVMDREQLGHVVEVGIGAWSSLITLILLGKLAYSMKKWWQSGRRIWWPRRRVNQDVENHVNGQRNQLELRARAN